MTDTQLKQAKSQLPQGEKFDRAYSAFEGGIRLISKKTDGTETRYKVHFEADGNVRIERFKEDSTMWREGSLKVHDSIFHYWMKQYDDGSQFGIEGGRISKLMLKRNDTIVCNYDRCWEIEPADPDTRRALETLLHGENQ